MIDKIGLGDYIRKIILRERGREENGEEKRQKQGAMGTDGWPLTRTKVEISFPFPRF